LWAEIDEACLVGMERKGIVNLSDLSER